MWLRRSLSSSTSCWSRPTGTTSIWCYSMRTTSSSGPTSTPSWGLHNSLGDCLPFTFGNRIFGPRHRPKQHAITHH
ncbi:hypothetical protein KY289_025143 [Solanum tuberosum]|nr:hypothetical protein KY289_025143 [Solanum tuberosum]